MNDFGERDLDLAFAIDQSLGAHEGHPHDVSLGVKAQRVTLGRLVEVGHRRRIPLVQVEHVDLGVVEDVVESEESKRDRIRQSEPTA